MSKLATFNTDDQRLIAAHQTVVDFGAGYLNSLVGKSPKDTCQKIENLMPFLRRQIDTADGGSFEDMRPVLSFLVQSIWTAVQYEISVGESADVVR